MSAESPKKAFRYSCNMVRPQPYSEKSMVESVVDFISDVVPQAYSGTHMIEDKEKIQWVRFEDADANDFAKNPDLLKSDSKGLPLLLILGYSNGIQIWHVTPNGEAQEVMSLRQGPVRVARLLPTPESVQGRVDAYASKRPLVAVCDSSSAGQPYCGVKFISVRTGDEVHNVSFKTLPLHSIECNKRFLVCVFHEKFCVYDACTFHQLFWTTSCYPCPGPSVNPVALATRWIAYADRRLVPMHQSCGGMSGDGSQSYAATVISAAKGAFKGLSMFGEAMVSSVTGNKTPYTNKKTDHQNVDNSCRPGIVTVVDIQNVHSDHFNVNEDNDGDGLIAHFHAHANEPVYNMAFDSSGTLLVTTCKLGHNFHVFRLMAHPCSSSLGAVHHLYTLHRGDTTAKVIDICFNHDSRWVTVSTHRGTTHIFPITPYGGSISVRTHCHSRVVNRASRFHKSAGLEDIEHSAAGRNSPILSSSPGSIGQYDHYPSLIRQNALNNNMGNPRLPPYPHPITIYPLYQIKQPLNLQSMAPGKKNLSPSHSPPGSDNIFHVASRFSTPRLCVIGSPKLSIERRESGKRPVDSLFIMVQSGTLVEYLLEPKAKTASTEKVSDDCLLELLVAGRMQWNLNRLKNSIEVRPPLPNNNPLILSREAVVTQTPTHLDVDPGQVTRQDSKESLSSDHSGKDDVDDKWVSQVEIITHTGPHRRLWMGPQFSFKTYQNVQNTTVLSSNSSALLSQSPEANMDLMTDECDLESLKLQPARSNPVSMPMTRPAYRRLSASDNCSSSSPGKGPLAPLMIEAGSFDQSPQLFDVCSNWAESTVEKQPRGSDDLEEDRIRETLAEAMIESPTKEYGPASIKQENSRKTTPKKTKAKARKEEESREKKKESAEKKGDNRGDCQQKVEKENEISDEKEQSKVDDKVLMSEPRIDKVKVTDSTGRNMKEQGASKKGGKKNKKDKNKVDSQKVDVAEEKVGKNQLKEKEVVSKKDPDEDKKPKFVPSGELVEKVGKHQQENDKSKVLAAEAVTTEELGRNQSKEGEKEFRLSAEDLGEDKDIHLVPSVELVKKEKGQQEKGKNNMHTDDKKSEEKFVERKQECENEDMVKAKSEKTANKHSTKYKNGKSKTRAENAVEVPSNEYQVEKDEGVIGCQKAEVGKVGEVHSRSGSDDSLIGPNKMVKNCEETDPGTSEVGKHADHNRRTDDETFKEESNEELTAELEVDLEEVEVQFKDSKEDGAGRKKGVEDIEVAEEVEPVCENLQTAEESNTNIGDSKLVKEQLQVNGKENATENLDLKPNKQKKKNKAKKAQEKSENLLPELSTNQSALKFCELTKESKRSSGVDKTIKSSSITVEERKEPVSGIRVESQQKNTANMNGAHQMKETQGAKPNPWTNGASKNPWTKREHPWSKPVNTEVGRKIMVDSSGDKKKADDPENRNIGKTSVQIEVQKTADLGACGLDGEEGFRSEISVQNVVSSNGKLEEKSGEKSRNEVSCWEEEVDQMSMSVNKLLDPKSYLSEDDTSGSSVYASFSEESIDNKLGGLSIRDEDVSGDLVIKDVDIPRGLSIVDGMSESLSIKDEGVSATGASSTQSTKAQCVKKEEAARKSEEDGEAKASSSEEKIEVKEDGGVQKEAETKSKKKKKKRKK